MPSINVLTQRIFKQTYKNVACISNCAHVYFLLFINRISRFIPRIKVY